MSDVRAMQRDIDLLKRHFTEAERVYTTSPLYRALCRAASSDEPTLRLLRHRRPGQKPSFLLFGAVHYLLLAGNPHHLRRFYPSILGDQAAGPADAPPAFIEFCHTHRDELAEIIGARLVQSNVVRRSLGLRVALSAIAAAVDAPVHLVEVGASAGIHLHVDRYRYVIDEVVSGPPDAPLTIESRWLGPTAPTELGDCPVIASRTGIDLHPVDVGSAEERRWLRSLVWPEEQSAAAQLEVALAYVAANPVRVIAGDAVEVARALGESLPTGEPRVVFHAATRMHVPPARRHDFDHAIDSIGHRGPLFHVWQEPADAPHAGQPVSEHDVLEFHGPATTSPTRLARVDGHLHWFAPIPGPTQ